MKVFCVPGPSHIGITTRPRGGDWLEDDVAAWKTAGVDVVVSCLKPAEVTELQLDDEAAACERHGLRFMSFPIQDRSVPKSSRAFAGLAAKLRKDLVAGKTIAVHCRQGIGRSALVVAGILVLGGERPRDAFQKIAEARGCDVPDTAEQRAWVQNLSRVMG